MENFIAGTMSGIAQTISGHPFDTIKVWSQTNNKFKFSNLKFKNIITYKKLYRGITGPLLTNALVIGTQFHFYHNYNSIVSGIFSALLITPIDYFKIQKQITGKYILKPKLSLYRPLIKSFPITMSREIIAMGLYFNSYYYLKKKTNNTFFSGGIAGILCWLPTYPIDTVKTRMQQGYNFKKSLKMGRLFYGIQIYLVRAFIVNSIGFYFAEKFMK